MKYRQAIEYLESFQAMGIRLGLERITALLICLGVPQNDFRSIHIAGTNGKGSVAAMLSSVLNRARYKVGLYISPHLIDYTERIRINERDVSRAKFAAAVAKVKGAIDELPEMNLTEFEVLTAVAFLLLSQEKVDFAVIETGLGGRLDATNIITPILSIITNIDHDHTDVLGSSIKKIAKEKAGIIKSGVPLVTGESKMRRFLYSICREKSSKFISSRREKVKYVPFFGSHQVENSKIVIASVKVLRVLGVKISGAQLNSGLRRAFWPGRLQIVGKDPLTILDGAHNPSGARALFKYLSTLDKKITFIIGMQRNKDVKGFVEILAPIADRFIVVRSGNPNALSKAILAKKIDIVGGHSVIAGNLKSAVSMAKRTGNPVCVAGSLYLVGDALKQKSFDL
ncbi:MAG: folylpolyglutamate synthase/dihydrofolate synthase family protein [bacterium]